MNLALNLLFAVPAIWLPVSGRLLNEELFDGLGWPTGADPSDRQCGPHMWPSLRSPLGT